MSERRGFTIVEALVAGFIVAILAAIVYSVAAPARERARQVACASNLRQIYSALQMYSADYDGGEQLPGLGDMKLCIEPPVSYLGSREAMHCPNMPKTAKRSHFSSYFWPIAMPPMDAPDIAMQRFQRDLLEKGGSTPIVYCSIHDETYYLPRERDIDPIFVGQYQIQLRLDGSVWRGRVRAPRDYVFTR